MKKYFLFLIVLMGVLLVNTLVFADESGGCQADPSSVAGHLCKASGENDPQFQQEYSDALLLYEKGQKDAGIYKLQSLLEKYPDSTLVLHKLGELAINEKNWAYAIEVLQKAARLDPHDTEIRLVLADIYRAYQMPVLEIMTYREILEIDPKNEESLKKLAGLYDDQNLPFEEEKVREMIRTMDPGNYENLERLVMLLFDQDDNWEELLVQRDIVEHYPDRIEALKRLAALYGIDEDIYHQLLSYKEILKQEPGDIPFKRSFRSAYEKYRQEQSIRDYAYVGNLFSGSRLQFYPYKDDVFPLYRALPFFGLYHYIPTGFSHESGVFFDQYDAGLNAGYEHIFLFGRGHVGIDTYARTTRYVPRAVSGLAGEQIIDTTYLGLNWETRDRWENNILLLQAGVAWVKAPKGIYAVPGLLPDNTALVAPTLDPWLERTPFGGSQFVYQADWYTKLANRFWADIYVQRGLMDDTDALVRTLTHQSYGLGLSYVWPNLAVLQGWTNWGTISDGNTRSLYTVSLDYPLLISGAVRGLQGEGRGSIRSIADAGLWFNYEGNAINYGTVSPYYESYQGEWINRAKLFGDLRIEKDLFFIAEGYYEWGKYVQTGNGFKVGLLYEEPINFNTLEINYQYGYQDVLQPNQLNPRLNGDFRYQGVELKMGWHF